MAPKIVVVSPKANVSLLPMEFPLQFKGLGIGRDHIVRPVLPELLDVAEGNQRVILLQVVAQGRLVAAFAAAEVVGPISRSFVEIREDDQPRRVQSQLLLLGRGILEGTGHPLGYLPLEIVKMLRRGSGGGGSQPTHSRSAVSMALRAWAVILRVGCVASAPGMTESSTIQTHGSLAAGLKGNAPRIHESGRDHLSANARSHHDRIDIHHVSRY